MRRYARLLLAEWLATYLLVAAGTGAIAVEQLTQQLGHGGVAAAFGLVVVVIIYAFGDSSGAHANPAVTIGFWAAGRLPGRLVLPYAAALMLLVLRVSVGAREKGITAGLAVGAMVALEALVAGPLTGASINPVRSLGPALVSGQLAGLWVYLTAPVAGALAAVALGYLLEEPTLPAA